MELIPIKKTLEENTEFLNNPDCIESLHMAIDFFNSVGYNPPWIGYYVKKENQIVGMAAYKGKPINNKVEIAYGAIERFQHQGVGTDICKMLVELSLDTDPKIEITAKTSPIKSASTRILEKNGFELIGTVIDKEDGEVWEWKLKN